MFSHIFESWENKSNFNVFILKKFLAIEFPYQLSWFLQSCYADQTGWESGIAGYIDVFVCYNCTESIFNLKNRNRSHLLLSH